MAFWLRSIAISWKNQYDFHGMVMKAHMEYPKLQGKVTSNLHAKSILSSYWVKRNNLPDLSRCVVAEHSGRLPRTLVSTLEKKISCCLY